jgi:hypothetical protein
MEDEKTLVLSFQLYPVEHIQPKVSFADRIATNTPRRACTAVCLTSRTHDEEMHIYQPFPNAFTKLSNPAGNFAGMLENSKANHGV